MSGAVVYRLRFRSPLHIGERGVGLEETRTYVPADTLFSALCTAWRWLYGVESLQSDLLAPFLQDEQPPFLLTSAFPFAEEVLFFPKPTCRGNVQVDDEDQKKFRHVRYLSQAIFASWLRGEEMEYTPPAEEDEPLLWFSPAEEGVLQDFIDESGQVRLWKEAVVPRVTLDRQTSASQIWFFGQVTFYRGAGLWCAFRYRDQSLRPRVEACLRLLGDSGLGGERGAGFGLFDLVVSQDITLPEVENTQYTITLSPCCPDKQQMESLMDDRCAYNLLPRRGWIGSPEGGNLRRRSVWMLEEGAVLRKTSEVPGRLVDVKPAPCPHAVWRYGYAFALGVKL